MMCMARNDPQINIRIPAKLKKSLEAAATENNRSVTSEIVERLEQSVSGPKHPPNIFVRLEALPYGSETQEVSLGTFFENFSRTVKATLDELNQNRPVATQMERGLDTLAPTLEESDEDKAIAEEAAESVRTIIREKRIREAENLARRYEERQQGRKNANEPDE